ncbi:MAG: YqgE/AlgH family protein [Pseudomonadota bacterium]
MALALVLWVKDTHVRGMDDMLTGKLLLAMPGMGDPRFENAVIFMCAHSSDGAMGLIINKSAIGVSFTDLVAQLDIAANVQTDPVAIHFGGPVDDGRGFVLHTSDYGGNDSTLTIDGYFGMTATLDVLEDIAMGQGPKTSLLALGYSGWGPGQLESEILANGWLTCDATPDIVFHQRNDQKWRVALKTLGIDPLLLSASAGRA